MIFQQLKQALIKRKNVETYLEYECTRILLIYLSIIKLNRCHQRGEMTCLNAHQVRSFSWWCKTTNRGRTDMASILQNRGVLFDGIRATLFFHLKNTYQLFVIFLFQKVYLNIQAFVLSIVYILALKFRYHFFQGAFLHLKLKMRNHQPFHKKIIAPIGMQQNS